MHMSCLAFGVVESEESEELQESEGEQRLAAETRVGRMARPLGAGDRHFCWCLAIYEITRGMTDDRMTVDVAVEAVSDMGVYLHRELRNTTRWPHVMKAVQERALDGGDGAPLRGRGRGGGGPGGGGGPDGGGGGDVIEPCGGGGGRRTSTHLHISGHQECVFHIIRFRYSQSCSGLSDRQLLSTEVYGQHESSNQIHLSAMR